MKNKGFTLIELILAIGIFSLVLLMAYPAINFTLKSQNLVLDEFNLQSDMRRAAQLVNSQVRNATAIFTLKEENFNHNDLREGWSYFTVGEDRSEIVHYLWAKDSTTGRYKHFKIPVVEKKDNIIYNLYFRKEEGEGNLINFTLEGYLQNNPKQKVVINTQLEALNSLQVVDRGDDFSFATVIAYRDDERPTPEINIIEETTDLVAITMVLDVSGSMAWDMWGRNANYPNRRIDILKEEAKKLIENFSTMENLYISLIPFSTSANNPGNFYRPADPQQKQILINQINGLIAFGGTNTGDGMRRAYYQLKNFNHLNTGRNISNYMILLVDGNPTFSSVIPQNDSVRIRQWPGYNNYWSTRTQNFQNPNHFLLADGNVDENVFLRVTNSRSRSGGQIYVRSTSNFSNNHSFTDSPGWVSEPLWNIVPFQIYGNQIIGTGMLEPEINVDNNMKYVEHVAENLIVNGGLDIETFVIGFSAVRNEIDRSKRIAELCGGSYYEAGDAIELEVVFEEIINIIIREQWHIFGP
ncbi:VWA domain-containing protein [Anaerobranca gottschalkii]|uniref:Prepilin-type N-terminal cleavage/methylation domain-containing protein n=1 Tax=Anaerobranca gottschalkii DSM 13577 TaxID=1120990 RepID=A0A1H9Y3I6_9FIRM|nr:VWA domain-containing protein [Anaerobranca gottschalkii]SES63369.1 prepilin-type N-terminal cleavage/methylation domain-containing protein [Anaerobranca gottschalkii DSM 13577]